MSHLVQFLRTSGSTILTLMSAESNAIADRIEQLERENAELLAALRTMISTFDGVLDGDAADAYGATDALKTACAAIAKHGGKNE